MCYSGVCPYERWSGECNKKAYQVCPAEYETAEEFYTDRDRIEEEQAMFKYEQQISKRSNNHD